MTEAGDPTDLLGRTMDESERTLLAVYAQLHELAARDDLAPCVTANVRSALAATAVAVADLGLSYEHLLDLGV